MVIRYLQRRLSPAAYWLRAVPPIFQQETSECGLACLAMGLRALGKDVELAAIRESAPDARRGRSIAGLSQIAATFGMHARAVRVPSLRAAERLTAPAILHWNGNHYVLLLARIGQQFLINDPADGQKFVDSESLFDNFTGIAMLLSATAELEKGYRAKKNTSVLSQILLQAVFSAKGRIASLIAMTFMLEALTIASPWFFKVVFDQSVLRADSTVLPYICGAMACIYILHAIAYYMRGVLLIEVSRRVINYWSLAVFNRLIRFPTKWFERHTSADVVARFSGIRQVQQALSVSFLDTIMSAIMGCGVLIVIYFLDSLFFVAGLLSVLALAFYAFWTDADVRQAAHTYLSRASREQSYFLETLLSIRTIHSQGHVHRRAELFANYATGSANASQLLRLIDLRIFGFNGFVLNASRVLFIYIGALSFFAGHTSVGEVVALLSYGEILMGRASALFNRLSDIRSLRVESERVSEMLKIDPERWDEFSTEHLINIGSLSIEGVTVYGDEGVPILRNCNIHVADGEYIAIMGPSGSGKSTLLDCIIGLRRPDEGVIRLGNRAIDDIPILQSRELFGTVLQSDVILSGTLRQNISLFDPACDEEHLATCVRAACLEQVVASLSMRLDTPIGEGGAKLSGGEAQRVMLARALYRRPRILVLDEATSALNDELVERINENVAALNMTRVVVSHRQSTFKHADRVFVVDAGQVSEVSNSD